MKKITFILFLFLVTFYTQAQTVAIQNEDCIDQPISKEEAHEIMKAAAFSLMGPYFDASLRNAIELAQNNPEAYVNGPATCFAPDTDPAVVAAFYRNRSFIENSLGIVRPNSRFNLNNRWSSTAISGGGLGQGDITTLTWSYVPNGTPIGNGGCGVPDIGGNSDFITFFNGIYGSPTTPGDYTTAPWHNVFVNMFNSWSNTSGLIFVYEPNDDGATVVTGGPGILGVRGDMRISGHPIDGNSGVLACNYYPQNGDMIIDTADNFFSNNPGTGTTNVLTHEIGHGVGIRHVCPISQTKLMEPFVTTAFVGPQEDDILATNRHYGDPEGVNDTPGTASFLGANATPTFYSKVQRSIDDNGDIDYFSFAVSGATTLSGMLTPTGTSYLDGVQNSNGSCSSGTVFNALTVSDLMLEVLNTDGVTILATADANGPGIAETFANVSLPLAGTYYVRVSQQGASINNTQMYDLDLSLAIPGLDTPPTATCINFTAQLDATGNVAITANNVDGGSSDPEGAVTLSVSPSSFTCAELGDNTVTLTVTDSAGQTDTCTATVTVVDSLSPVWTNPGVTIPAFLDGTGSITLAINDADAIITAADNCNPIIGISILGDAAARTFTCTDLGTNPTVQVQLRDDTPGVPGNNDSIITVGVDLQDNISPIITCATNATRNTDIGDCGYTVVGTEFDSTFTDNCNDGTITNDFSNLASLAGAIIPNGVTTVVWTVDDGNGQIVTCSRVITVNDTENPVVTCPADIVIDNDPGACDAVVSFMTSATDNCAGATTSSVPASGSVFSLGTTTVSVTATDAAGNTDLCTFTVTVNDTEDPVTICPADITVELGAGSLFYAVPDYFATAEATATDNCTDPITILSQNPAAGTMLAEGAYTINMIAEDEFGNIGSCTFELTINTVLGVDDIELSLESIVMYPNPVKDFVILSNPKSIALQQATIYDLTGRLIQTTDLTAMGTETNIDISLLEIAPYFIVIQTEKGQVIKQLLKE